LPFVGDFLLAERLALENIRDFSGKKSIFPEKRILEAPAMDEE
jgi:hypothetical protein